MQILAKLDSANSITANSNGKGGLLREKEEKKSTYPFIWNN